MHIEDSIPQLGLHSSKVEEKERNREIIRSIRDEPKTFIGSIIKCPCHGDLLRVTKVSNVNAGYYNDGTWQEFIFVTLEDGSITRFWLVEE